MAKKADASGKLARAEEGVCALCGAKTTGIPAKKDFAISAARKLREILRLPSSHTIACKNCLPKCIERRAKFEAAQRNYRIYAALFFALLVGGSFILRGFDLRVFLPAAIGCSIILLLPYGSYFPKFDAPGGK